MNKTFFLLPVLSLVVSSTVQGQTPRVGDNKANTNTLLPPPTMTKKEILSLLTEANHISNQREIVDRESARVLLKRPVLIADKEYPMVAQQDAAINNAGELKDKDFIPCLIDYLDYVSPNTLFNSSARTAGYLEVRKERYPALNALIKINAPEAMISYIQTPHPLGKRLAALGVLTDVNYDQAVVVSNQLLQDPEVKKDPKRTSWIQTLIQKKAPKIKIAPVK
jgi:hypothetical protein